VQEDDAIAEGQLTGAEPPFEGRPQRIQVYRLPIAVAAVGVRLRIRFRRDLHGHRIVVERHHGGPGHVGGLRDVHDAVVIGVGVHSGASCQGPVRESVEVLHVHHVGRQPRGVHLNDQGVALHFEAYLPAGGVGHNAGIQRRQCGREPLAGHVADRGFQLHALWGNEFGLADPSAQGRRQAARVGTPVVDAVASPGGHGLEAQRPLAAGASPLAAAAGPRSLASRPRPVVDRRARV
jgi:hypothetical protein